MASAIGQDSRLYKYPKPSSTIREQTGRFKPMPESEKSYSWLLQYPEIKQFANSVRHPKTRAYKLYYLSNFFNNGDTEKARTFLDKVIARDDLGVKNMALEYIRELERKGITASIMTFSATIRGLVNNYHHLDKLDVGFFRWKDNELPPPHVGRKEANQRIPSPQEIYAMSDAGGGPGNIAGLRFKATTLFLFQSGCRGGVLANLKYGHIAPCLYGTCYHDHPINRADGMKLPIYIQITDQVDTKLKIYHTPYYYTFLGIEAATAIREYIEWRKAGREVSQWRTGRAKAVDAWTPQDDDPLFVTREGKPLINDMYREQLRRAGESIGFKKGTLWPHLMRKAFRKVLRNSILTVQDNDWKNATMGWKMEGVHANYYDDKDLLDMANKYVLCDFSRQGNRRVLDQIQDQKGRIDELEMKLGRKDDEIKVLNREIITIRTRERIEVSPRSRRREPLTAEDMEEALQDPEIQRMFKKLASSF